VSATLPLMPVALTLFAVLLITGGGWPPAASLPAALAQALTVGAALMTAGTWLWRWMHRH